MEIVVAVLLLGLLAAVWAYSTRRRRRKPPTYPPAPDTIKRCTNCGHVLRAGATDCDACGGDSVVIVL